MTFNKDVPVCCDPKPAPDTCYHSAGISPSGDAYETYFADGDYLWLGDDSTLANCLIDLHYRQNTKCISVEGSKCEDVRGTSKILNAQMGYASKKQIHGHFGDGDFQLDAAGSRAMQAASNDMVGERVKRVTNPPAISS